MRRFRYSLESLLRFRQARLDEELAKLDKATSAVSQIDRSRCELDQVSREALQSVGAAGPLEGWQLSALDQFRRFATLEDRRLVRLRGQLVGELEEQRRRAVEAHKKVRILEVLKEKRLEDWKSELDREQEQAVSEVVAARWVSKQNR